MVRTTLCVSALLCCLVVLPVPPTPLAPTVAAVTTPSSWSAVVDRSASRPAPVPAESEPTGELAALRDKVRRVLRIHFAKNLNTRDHSPWSIMHATIAFGVDTQVRAGGPNGAPVTSVGWLCFNQSARRQRLFIPSGEHFRLRKGPGVQGHSGQLLAILAQAHVMSDYPIKVKGRDFTVADLIAREKWTCVARSELTFKLIALSHYLDSDATWQSQNGQQWSIPRLIREELAQPIQGAACGGSHRLMGLSYAVRKRATEGKPIGGEYRRAMVFVRDYQEYTFKLQNRDGSFSTDWFRGRGNRPDPERKLTTTGHILEWLAFSLPEKELTDPRTQRAAAFVSNLLLRERQQEWKIGALGHALHALVLYDRRVFGGTAADYRHQRPGQPRQTVAAIRSAKATVRPVPAAPAQDAS